MRARKKMAMEEFQAGKPIETWTLLGDPARRRSASNSDVATR